MRAAGWSIGFFAICAVAQARAAPRDPAAAQALFDEGMALLKTGAYAKACSKLEESQLLDAGIGTLFHLADCYERSGRTASAWAGFLEVASMAKAQGHADRQQAARKRAARLESRLGRIRIVVPDAARVAGLRVERDGVAVGSAQWDSALPADPGEHELVVTAPGYLQHRAKVNVGEGQTSEFEVPLLEAGADTVPPSSSPTPVPAAADVPPPDVGIPSHPQPIGSASSLSPVVIGLGALGLVGLGAGTTLGLMARSKYENSKVLCNPGDENRCSERGIELRDESITLANFSTVGFAVGGAAVIGAATVWWIRTRSTPVANPTSAQVTAGIQAGPSQGSVVLLGRF